MSVIDYRNIAQQIVGAEQEFSEGNKGIRFHHLVLKLQKNCQCEIPPHLAGEMDEGVYGYYSQILSSFLLTYEGINNGDARAIKEHLRLIKRRFPDKPPAEIKRIHNDRLKRGIGEDIEGEVIWALLVQDIQDGLSEVGEDDCLPQNPDAQFPKSYNYDHPRDHYEYNERSELVDDYLLIEAEYQVRELRGIC